MTSRIAILLGAGLMMAAPLVASAPASAEPGGCLKYGAVGAVGGHVVHHGVAGAVGGCATGMYVRHKYRKEARAKAAMWDHEHPGDHRSYDKKAVDYDGEHNTQPGSGSAPGEGGHSM